MDSLDSVALKDMSNRMNSIKSSGGPLICVESELAQSWLGVRGNSILKGPDRVYSSDYERACRVPDYVGKVALENRSALILGDMPLETLIWSLPDQLPRIVRVFYADPGVDVTKVLESTQELDFTSPIELTEVDIGSVRMVVFDSAIPGKDVGNMYVSFELSPGPYSVFTKRFQPDDRTSVLAHKFERGKPSRGVAGP